MKILSIKRMLLVYIFFLSMTMVGQHEVRASFGVYQTSHQTLGIDYEYLIDDEFSFRSSVGYLKSLNDAFTNYSGYSILGEIRYYYNPFNRDNSRFYSSAYLKYKHRNFVEKLTQILHNSVMVNNVEKSIDVGDDGLALGSSFGYKYVSNSNVTVDFWIGLGAFVYGNQYFSDDFNLDADSHQGYLFESLLYLELGGGISLGYRF